MSVKEFLKSVNIWWRYKQKFGGMFFFWLTVYIHTRVYLYRATWPITLYVKLNSSVFNKVENKMANYLKMTQTCTINRMHVDKTSRKTQFAWNTTINWSRAISGECPQMKHVSNKPHLYSHWHSQHKLVTGYSLVNSDTYSVSQKNPSLKFCGNFSKTVAKFLTKFYVSIMCSYLCLTANFYSITCNFDEVMPYLAWPPSSHHVCKMSRIGRNARSHFLTFSPNTREFFVQILHAY